jgi:type VI secretion system secreted protein VgrG
MVTEVGHDAQATVGHDRRTTVRHDDVLTIERNQQHRVMGDREDEIHGQFVRRVTGNVVDELQGNLHGSVSGSSDCRIVKDEIRWVGGNSTATVAAAESRAVGADLTTWVKGVERHSVGGMRDLRVGDDLIVRVQGCHVVLVGKSDAQRSHVLHVEGTNQISSSGTSEIVSDKSLLLRCGDSSIKLTPSNIELSSPALLFKGKDTMVSLAEGKLSLVAKADAILSGDKVTVTSSGATLTLDANAKLEGGKVALASGSGKPEALEAADPEPPTTIELKDQDGKPIPYARYVLVFDDGAEHSGVLDAEGKAELHIEGSPKILFPDAGSVKGK